MKKQMVKTWSRKQLKKARWKRSVERAKKHGPVYGGFIRFTDELEIEKIDLPYLQGNRK